MALPTLLFRGDRDDNLETAREVRQLWHTGYLRTNLIDGNAIWSTPLIGLVRRHVDPGWRATHFLSFSEDRARAEAFAKGRNGETKTLEALPDDASQWDAAIFTLDTSRCRSEATQQLCPGLWLTEFDERPLQHSTNFFDQLAATLAYQNRAGAPVRMLLVDVVTALKAQPQSVAPDHVRAIANALRDREWLVLPLDPFPDNPSQFTCVLSGSCLAKREKFRVRA